jgi:hypothetical protein
LTQKWEKWPKNGKKLGKMAGRLTMLSIPARPPRPAKFKFFKNLEKFLRPGYMILEDGGQKTGKMAKKWPKNRKFPKKWLTK